MDGHIENTFYDLLGLMLSGDATAEELMQLQALLNQYPELEALHNNILQHPSPKPYSDEMLEQVYAGHYFKKKFLPGLQQQNMAKRPAKPVGKSRIIKYFFIAAASVVLLLTINYFKFLKPYTEATSQQQNVNNEMATTKGSKSKLQLPDGTTVFLNADSRITYAADFNVAAREVTLTGEAYFDVKHDAAHPFIIHTGKADIKVLGTAFNVRNYPNEDLLETSLIRGKIEVTIADEFHNKFVLRPSDKLVISKSKISEKNQNNKNIIAENVINLTRINISDSAIAELSWMNNKAAFVNKTLEDIATELERQFNISITFKTDAVKKYRYTIYQEGYDLDEIMQVLQLSRKFNYTIIPNKELIIE